MIYAHNSFPRGPLSLEAAQIFLRDVVAHRGDHLHIICQERHQGKLLKKAAESLLKSGALHDPRGNKIEKLYVEYTRPNEKNREQKILTAFELKVSVPVAPKPKRRKKRKPGLSRMAL